MELIQVFAPFYSKQYFESLFRPKLNRLFSKYTQTIFGWV